jgi:hypothetical protein
MQYLPIVINNVSIHPNEHGMYCLNEIFRAVPGLKQTKQPNQWRTKEADHYALLQKLQVRNLGDKGQETWADEEAAVGYAAWVDLGFKLMVYSAFVAIRHSPEATNALLSNLDPRFREAFAANTMALYGRESLFGGRRNYAAFDRVCNSIGLPPVLARAALVHRGLLMKRINKNLPTEVRLFINHKKIAAKGYGKLFHARRYKQGEVESYQLMVTATGYDWLTRNRKRIGDYIDKMSREDRRDCKGLKLWEFTSREPDAAYAFHQVGGCPCQ